jgi:ABC-type transporter Mla subunit MlaD
MSDDRKPDALSDAEIGKDAIQSTVEAAATAVGEVATILTAAVRDVATAIGGFATEVFEIREATRKAQDQAGSGEGHTEPGHPERGESPGVV